MALNYPTFVTQLATLTAESTSDPNFVSTLLPGSIDYAEQRLYRELDIVATRISDTGTLIPNNGILTYPTNVGYFIVIEAITVSSSIPTGPPTTLQVCSVPYIQNVYPNTVGKPEFFAPLTDTTCLLGPAPDEAYNFSVLGTQHGPILSAANSSTWFTQHIPDLFMAAAMIYASGYMKNFGSQADNAQQAQSWQGQYDKLFASANTEELRKKYNAQAWQNKVPAVEQRV